MDWLRLVGSLKLQVSFAKEPYKRDDILQKRLLIWRRLLIVATPYWIKYVWHAAFIISTLIDDTIRMSSMKHVWYAACRSVTWLVYPSRVTRANALRPRRNESYYIYDWVTPYILKAANLGNCDVWFNATRDTHECVMAHMNASRNTEEGGSPRLHSGEGRLLPSSCGVLRCVAVCCGVLQCLALCCSVL